MDASDEFVVEIEIPRLRGWLTPQEAGERLGVHSKQGIHRLIWDAQEFDFQTEMRLVGARSYVIRESAVDRLVQMRELYGDRRNPAWRDAEANGTLPAPQRLYEDDEVDDGHRVAA